jgi:hypothetical protein
MRRWLQIEEVVARCEFSWTWVSLFESKGAPAWILACAAGCSIPCSVKECRQECRHSRWILWIEQSPSIYYHRILILYRPSSVMKWLWVLVSKLQISISFEYFPILIIVNACVINPTRIYYRRITIPPLRFRNLTESWQSGIEIWRDCWILCFMLMVSKFSVFSLLFMKNMNHHCEWC